MGFHFTTFRKWVMTRTGHRKLNQLAYHEQIPPKHVLLDQRLCLRAYDKYQEELWTVLGQMAGDSKESNILEMLSLHELAPYVRTAGEFKCFITQIVAFEYARRAIIEHNRFDPE